MTSRSTREEVKKRVYALADEVDWMHLNIDQRRRYYEEWTESPDIGGLLREIMSDGRIRVYIKDSIIGSYCRSKRLGIRDLLISTSIGCGVITKEYVKPQAILCDGKFLYTLINAKDWKVSLINSFERGQEVRGIKRNLMFITEHTSGRFVDYSYRSIIGTAAKRLGVEIEWVT